MDTSELVYSESAPTGLIVEAAVETAKQAKTNEAVTPLNRFGHGISYSQVQELETSRVVKEFALQTEYPYVPNVIKSGVCVNFAWDNNDLKEKTVTCAHTAHCTNGIIIQERVFGPESKPIQPTIYRTKKLSLEATQQHIADYISGQRYGPQRLHSDIIKYVKKKNVDTHLDAIKLDFCWLSTRLPAENALFEFADVTQQVPGWSGFNALILQEEQFTVCNVAYLPTIDQSPTELSTVYKLLNNSKAIVEKLMLKYAVITFDQAVYAKALEILFHNPIELNNILTRMGAFHIFCTLLAVIGKRFVDDDLRDIFIESNIVASGSVDGVLDGGHYNRAVRSHRIVLEALIRRSWVSFFQWLNENREEFSQDEVLRYITCLRDSCNQTNADSMLHPDDFQILFALYWKFLKDCRTSNGSVSAVWLSYMALLQSMKNIPATFKEITNTIHKALMIRNARRIYFLTDRYPDISIKNTERNQRGAEGSSLLVKIAGGNQRRPQQWKKFLSHGKKSNLIEFLLKEWSKDTYAETIAQRELSVAVDDDCYKLTSENVTVIKELQQDLVTPQEEADTRMFLHAAHASQQGYEAIVIKSSDTDVGVLAVYYSRKISGSFILATGTGNKRRFIDVNGISQKYGENICETLPGLHAFTGCDSVSAFSGKGKQSAVKVILKDEGLCETVKKLGQSYTVSEEVMEKCEMYVCILYGKSGADVNDELHELFCQKGSESSQLPPTKDALIKHKRGANYQAAIWRLALDAGPDVPTPHGHGWIL